VYRLIISLKESGLGYYFVCRMVAPVLGASRQLFRDLPGARIVRVRIQKELLHKLQDPLAYVVQADSANGPCRPRMHIKDAFKTTFLSKFLFLMGKRVLPSRAV
jgi:hypothetical protein